MNIWLKVRVLDKSNLVYEVLRTNTLVKVALKKNLEYAFLFLHYDFTVFNFSGLLSAVDLVEVNPLLAASEEEVNATAKLAVNVIATCFGQTREGAHSVFDDLPTPSSPDELDSEEEIRI